MLRRLERLHQRIRAACAARKAAHAVPLQAEVPQLSIAIAFKHAACFLLLLLDTVCCDLLPVSLLRRTCQLVLGLLHCSPYGWPHGSVALALRGLRKLRCSQWRHAQPIATLPRSLPHQGSSPP